MPKFSKEYTILLNKAMVWWGKLTQTQRFKIIIDNYLNNYLK